MNWRLLESRRVVLLLASLMLARGIWLLIPFDWSAVGASQPPRNLVLIQWAPLWVWGVGSLVIATMQLAVLRWYSATMRRLGAILAFGNWVTQGILLGTATGWRTEVSAQMILAALFCLWGVVRTPLEVQENDVEEGG